MSRRITERKLFSQASKYFFLKKFNPLDHTFKDYARHWEVLNMSDFNAATAEQLAFMVAILNGAAGVA